MGNFLDQTGLKTLLGLIKTKTTTLIQNYAADNLPVLDSTGKIPSGYLPGYVDDVLEFEGTTTSAISKTSEVRYDADMIKVLFNTISKTFIAQSKERTDYFLPAWKAGDKGNASTAYGTASDAGVVPSSGKLYMDTTNNKMYRWTGSALVDVSSQEVGTTNFAMTTLGVASWKENGTSKSAALAEATTSSHGLMSASDKAKLNGIAAGANNYTYTLPAATSSALGGIKTGYTTSGKNYKVQLDSSNNAYVNVPWTDNDTTYSALTTDEITAAVTAAWT